MKKFIMSVLAIIFPWMVFLIYDNPGAALVAVILQATAIGWIPASFWALSTVLAKYSKKKKKKKKKSTPTKKIKHKGKHAKTRNS